MAAAAKDTLNYYCRGKEINIKYHDNVFVTIVVPACKAHAPFYTIFGLYGFYVLVYKRNDLLEQNVIETKMLLETCRAVKVQ
jgi:hypothetical protein